MADFSKSLAKRSFCLHYWNFQKIKSRRTNNSIKRNSNMFSVFLLRVGDLIKPRTVEYYERVHWRSEECNFEIHPQDYLGHFSVKTFLLTILIQRVNLIRILGMSRIIEQKSSSSRWRLWTKTINRCEIRARLGGFSALFIGVSFSGFHSNRQSVTSTFFKSPGTQGLVGGAGGGEGRGLSFQVARGNFRDTLSKNYRGAFPLYFNFHERINK